MFYLLRYLCFNLINMFAMIALTFFRIEKQYVYLFFFLTHSAVICFQTEAGRRLSSRLLPVGGTV